MTEKEVKEAVAATMRRLYERGLTTSTGGNTSARFGSLMAITPSGKDKSSLTADNIALVDLKSGENLSPFKLSIETEMHRRIYLERADVNSVVHSHPTFSCLYSASKESINLSLIAESYYLLGERVEKVPYCLMGTVALAEKVALYIKNNDALLLENHGSLATGKTLLNAFDRLECLEQAAKLTFLSHFVPCGDIKDIDKANIIEMRK